MPRVSILLHRKLRIVGRGLSQSAMSRVRKRRLGGGTPQRVIPRVLRSGARGVGITFVLLAFVPALAFAGPGKIGLIGDSMMVATHSNQMCGSGGEVLQCFENRLGDHDLAFSHGAGDFPWSIARRLGYGDGAILNAADDGEEWKDALAQAQVITSDPDVNAVFIHLGANDVCADYGHDYSNDLAETAAEIDATLSHLVTSLPEGATIYWSGTVDVVAFRDALVDRRHNFAFKTCQGLWDLDPDNISDEAVRSLCKQADIPSDVCNGLSEWDAIREPLLDELVGFFIDAYNIEQPCGRVLDRRNTEAELQQARDFNAALNALLEAKAQAWSAGQNRVRIVFTNALSDLEIPPYFVSRLDCFHPNRAGQMNLAEEIWKGFNPEAASNVAFFVDEFDDVDDCTQEFTSWDSCWYDYGDPGFTIGVDGRNRFRVAKETSRRREHFVARDLGDLSDKTFAWMSFNHKRESLDNGDDRVTLEVLADGFWYELDVFKGGGNDKNAHPGEYYDLTPYLSSDVRIQFRPSTQKSMKNGEGVRLDNFNIFAWGPAVPVPEPGLGPAASGLLVLALAAMRIRRDRQCRVPRDGPDVDRA